MLNKRLNHLTMNITALLMLASCNSNEENTIETEHNQNEKMLTHIEAPETKRFENAQLKPQNDAKTTTPQFTNADISSPESIQILVNKHHAIPSDYVPEDLVYVEVPTVLESDEVNQLRSQASTALTEMFNHALEYDIQLFARSGYRSYTTQKGLYHDYVSNHGQEAADRYSAKPGHSEHQTGLAMDVTSASVNYQLVESFEDTLEGQWVRDHAHEFGFIIRYPKGKEDITGYIYEPWHLRYLGVELATDVYESDLTYEEYIQNNIN